MVKIGLLCLVRQVDGQAILHVHGNP